MTENELTPSERHEAIQKSYQNWLNAINQKSEDEILTEATNRYIIEDEIEAFIQGANWIQEKLKI
jgi:hypothetical protein